MEAVILTPDNYPTMFTLCTAIVLDNGLNYGKKEFTMPLCGIPPLMEMAERGVKGLTAEELEEFACGEQEEISSIAQRNSDLAVAHCLLNAFFDTL